MIHHPGKTLAELIEDGVSPIIVPCHPDIYFEIPLGEPMTDDDAKRFQAWLNDTAEAVQKRIDKMEAADDNPS